MLFRRDHVLFSHADGDARSFKALVYLSVTFVVLTIAFLAFIALESTRRIDASAEANERAAIEGALSESVSTMGKKAIEYSLWNDAVDNMVIRFNPAWINANTGPYAERLWGLDRSYAIDSRNELIYASAQGALRTDAQEAAREMVDLLPVFAAARSKPEALSGIVRIGHTFYIFGARVIEYEEGHPSLPPNPELPVQVFLKALDDEVAGIAASRQIRGLRFVMASKALAHAGTVGLPVRDITDQEVGYLLWQPERPGHTIVAEVAPYGIGFAVALVVLLMVFLRLLLRLRRQEALRLSEARLAQAQRIARLAYAAHLPHDILEVSSSLLEIIGLSPGARLTSTSAYLDLVEPGHRQDVQDAYRKAWLEDTRFEIEYPLSGFDGRMLYMQEVGEPFHDAGGSVLGLMTAIQDVTERKQAEATIRYQANYDALTGLPNRTLFFDRLQQATRCAVRDGNRTALLFIDLNRFKWVNDTLGHGTGDILLREVAQRLSSCIRKSETIARLGGDEFTVVLSAIHAGAEVEPVVHRILQCLDQPFHIEGQTLHISASIGITLSPDQGTEVQQLVKNADVAMYHAKRQGEAWAYYSPEMDADAIERLRLENDLREAVHRDQLKLYLQPIFDTKTGRLAGAEALVRWQHPDHGLLLPATFIPLAEANGMIVPIGEWILNAAGRQLALWRELGHTPLRLAVNVSGAQIKHSEFEALVQSVVRNYSVRPNHLILEITENVMLDTSAETLRVMKALREIGISFAIDDFGTGYSSLSYLRRLPVDILKVDQSFVQSMAGNPDNQAVFQAIVNLAQVLRLETIAEGVESNEQRVLVEQMNCDYVQGYFFGKPIPAEIFCKTFVTDLLADVLHGGARHGSMRPPAAVD